MEKLYNTEKFILKDFRFFFLKVIKDEFVKIGYICFFSNVFKILGTVCQK